MASYVEIESLVCDPPQVAMGQSVDVAFDLHNIGDEDAQSVPVTITAVGPGGETVSEATHEMGPVAIGTNPYSRTTVPAECFNAGGSYTIYVTTPGGGSGACTFTVG